MRPEEEYQSVEDEVLNLLRAKGCEVTKAKDKYAVFDIIEYTDSSHTEIKRVYEVKGKSKNYGDVFCDAAKELRCYELGIGDKLRVVNLYFDTNTMSIANPSNCNKKYVWKWCDISTTNKLKGKEWQLTLSCEQQSTISRYFPYEQQTNFDFSHVNYGKNPHFDDEYPVYKYREKTEWMRK